MTNASSSTATPVVRVGFILVHETLCDGVIPAESDGGNQIVVYQTRAEAEVELADAAEMRADSMSAAAMEQEDDDRWLERVVLQPHGTLVLIDQGLAFTEDALRALRR